MEETKPKESYIGQLVCYGTGGSYEGDFESYVGMYKKHYNTKSIVENRQPLEHAKENWHDQKVLDAMNKWMD